MNNIFKFLEQQCGFPEQTDGRAACRPPPGVCFRFLLSLFISYLYLFYTAACCSPALTDCSGRGKKIKKYIYQVSLWEGGWVGESQLEREEKTERIFYSLRMMIFFFSSALFLLEACVLDRREL